MAELPYNIEYLRSICKDENIFITVHVHHKFIERGITLGDIKDAISNGEIIEKYPDDKPLPSCLISGKDNKNLYVHMVLSADAQLINIITAYHPDNVRWKNDFKTRKRGS